MHKSIILPLLLLITISLHAAIVDTINIRSESMQKDIKCVVIRPKTKAHLPVVYLLHGYSGNYSNWIMKVPELKQYADEFKLIIVCPDGDYSSWYFDSPVDHSKQYETYISQEVPSYIDTHYRTIKNRYARAITGLSMGGHGGLYLGFRHADFFGACGSMSGGVDMNSLKTKYEIMNILGDTLQHADNWKAYSVMNVVAQPLSQPLAIIIDCGTEDFFYPDNQALHAKMLRLHIPHEYIQRPGMHDWKYWANAVKYQLFFFHEYFNKEKGK